MSRNILEDAINEASQEIDIELAITSGQIEEAQRVRYRVYCEERGFEPGQDGREVDRFDVHARHILLRSRETGQSLGTVRLVLPQAVVSQDNFPMNQLCDAYVLRPLPLDATGEISRFALRRDRSGISAAAAALMRLSLMRGIVQISGLTGLTHWCAVMEKSLLRLLRSTAIHFEAVGPMVEHHGLRQPAVADIGSVLNRIRREQPAIWNYITNQGTFWTDRFAADTHRLGVS